MNPVYLALGVIDICYDLPICGAILIYLGVTTGG